MKDRNISLRFWMKNKLRAAILWNWNNNQRSGAAVPAGTVQKRQLHLSSVHLSNVTSSANLQELALHEPCERASAWVPGHHRHTDQTWGSGHIMPPPEASGSSRTATAQAANWEVEVSACKSSHWNKASRPASALLSEGPSARHAASHTAYIAHKAFLDPSFPIWIKQTSVSKIKYMKKVNGC